MATFKAVILKGNVHIRKDGMTNVKIRITHNRGIAYISTDLYVIADSFRNGWVTKGKDKAYLNNKIADKLSYYQKEYLKLELGTEMVSANNIKERITRSYERIDFYEFADSVISELERDGKTGTADRWHKPAVSALKKFHPNLSMSDIDLQFLKDFERFLSGSGVGSGINNYMRSFRAIFNKAREYYNDEDSGLIRIPQYPFARYKIPKANLKRSVDSSLTPEELKMFINYKPKRETEQYAKDISLLMFYLIGINAKDLFYMKKPVDGRICYDRFKTGREYSIKLEPEAIEIINKYPGRDEYLINAHEKFVDHMNFLKSINHELHGEPKRGIPGILNELGIKKHVTSNWFRHTWATIARNDCRIDKDDVALCLGHEDSDNRVTDIYIKYDYSIIDESNRKVIDFINGI